MRSSARGWRAWAGRPKSRTDDDVIVVVDLPDSAAATGLSLALARTGSFRVTTTVLLTAAEMDAGASTSPSYRAPGT